MEMKTSRLITGVMQIIFALAVFYAYYLLFWQTNDVKKLGHLIYLADYFLCFLSTVCVRTGFLRHYRKVYISMYESGEDASDATLILQIKTTIATIIGYFACAIYIPMIKAVALLMIEYFIRALAVFLIVTFIL